jgi:hypothetical protein
MPPSKTDDTSGASSVTPAVYVRVIVLEAAIIAALWLFGRSFH